MTTRNLETAKGRTPSATSPAPPPPPSIPNDEVRRAIRRAFPKVGDKIRIDITVETEILGVTPCGDLMIEIPAPFRRIFAHQFDERGEIISFVEDQ